MSEENKAQARRSWELWDDPDILRVLRCRHWRRIASNSKQKPLGKAGGRSGAVSAEENKALAPVVCSDIG